MRAYRLAIFKQEEWGNYPFSAFAWWPIWRRDKKVNSTLAWEYPLLEGCGFVGDDAQFWHNTTSCYYDPARCGAFADWIEENTERLTQTHTEEDRPLATERLLELARWLRRGLQISA